MSGMPPNDFDSPSNPPAGESPLGQPVGHNPQTARYAQAYSNVGEQWKEPPLIDPDWHREIGERANTLFWLTLFTIVIATVFGGFFGWVSLARTLSVNGLAAFLGLFALVFHGLTLLVAWLHWKLAVEPPQSDQPEDWLDRDTEDRRRNTMATLAVVVALATVPSLIASAINIGTTVDTQNLEAQQSTLAIVLGWPLGFSVLLLEAYRIGYVGALFRRLHRTSLAQQSQWLFVAALVFTAISAMMAVLQVATGNTR